MLKRLWQIFGPVICALVLVVIVIYAYPQGRKYSYEAEKRRHFQTLSLFDDFYKGTGFRKAIVGTGVKPGETAL